VVDEPGTDVWVFIGERLDRATDRRLIADVVAGLLGVAADSVRVDRECEWCGGDHGRPTVRTTGSPAPQVSLSRAGGRVAVAVTWLGPVGIDIESIASVASAPLDGAAFAPSEVAALRRLDGAEAAWARASMWTAKEAILKLTGEGLRRDPRELGITMPDRASSSLAAAALGGTGLPASIRLERFDAGPLLVGAVAVVAAGAVGALGRPRIRVVDATAQSRAGRAIAGSAIE
jgi:4'-phosphopantetheinyl transferase